MRGALGVGVPGSGVRPFTSQGSVEPLDFAVGPWTVGLDELLSDAMSVDHATKCRGLAVCERVVSLSSFLCKCGGWGLEVGLDSVGVGECELAECLFPVRDDESFNQTSLGKSFGSSGQSAFFCSVTSPFVFDIADRQPQ